MRKTTRLVCSIAVSLCAISAATAQDDENARKAELKKLQGTWIVQTASRDGKERKDETGAVMYLSGDQLMIRLANHTEFMYMDLGVQNLNEKPKHIWFRPNPDPDARVKLKIALDIYGAAGYQIDGDNLKVCFLAAQAWPKEISDKGQVLWVLRRDTAEYRREKLDKRLHGKQILHYEKILKEGDKIDRDVEFTECWYIGCKDTHDYFLEPYPDPMSLYNSGPFPKFTKVLHGLRVVQHPKGELVVIENWYAGAKHGTSIHFQNGNRSSEASYAYGKLHGMSRRYQGGQIWNEENYVEGHKVSARYFHSNGQPSDYWEGNVLRDERDEKGNVIPTRKIEMQKLYGAWEIVTATKDGKSRDREKGGELTFIGDDVRLKLPDSKETMTMNVHLRRPGTHPYIDFHPIATEPRFRTPLDDVRGGRYAIDGNTLTISFRTAEGFPADLSDKGLVLWVLMRKVK